MSFTVSFQANFEKFDRDRSGRIDALELREALLSLGFSVPHFVLDLLVLKFDKSGGMNKAIEYDHFIEYVSITIFLSHTLIMRFTTWFSVSNSIYVFLISDAVSLLRYVTRETNIYESELYMY